jgi:hypothetical protein
MGGGIVFRLDHHRVFAENIVSLSAGTLFLGKAQGDFWKED